MTFIYAFPAWVALLLVPGSMAAIACAGHLTVRRRVAVRDLVSHNEVAGFVYAVVGVVYAVVLGFVVVIVWQQFNDSDERSQAEVAAVANAWRLAGAYLIRPVLRF